MHLQGAVDDHDVPLVDIGSLHRVAHDAGKECRRRVADQLPIQVNRLQSVVLRRRGEAGKDPLLGIGQGEPLAHLHLVKPERLSAPLTLLYSLIHGSTKITIFPPLPFFASPPTSHLYVVCKKRSPPLDVASEGGQSLK